MLKSLSKRKFNKAKIIKELYNRFKKVWFLHIQNLGRFYLFYSPEEFLTYPEEEIEKLEEEIDLQKVAVSFVDVSREFDKRKKNFLFFSDAFLFCPIYLPLEKGNIFQRIFKVFEKYIEENTYTFLKQKISSFWSEEVLSIEPSFTDFYISFYDRKIPLSLAGDGVKSFIVNFLSLYLKTPSYLFFEEPENFMHPKMMEIFAECVV